MVKTSNVKVLLFVESRYQLNRKRIQSTIQDKLKAQGIEGPIEISVAIVGDRKMRELNKKHRGLDKTTNVLSFPLAEGASSYLPSDVRRVGDIVISYPEVIRQAAEDEMLVDDKIEELVVHGLMHLLGQHHE